MPPKKAIRMVSMSKKGKKGGSTKNSNSVSAYRTSEGEIIDRGIPLYPSRFRAHLPYFMNGTVTTGVVSAGNYLFSANGLFDPDVTVAGHQPMGFDQMMISYDHYTVTASKIEVSFRNSSATASVTVGICLQASTVATAAIYDLVESGAGVRKRLNLSTTGDSTCTLELACPVSKYLGIPKLLDSSIARGDAASNPSEQCYFSVFAYNTESTSSVPVFMEVIIHFEVWFTEPRRLPSSLRTSILSLISEHKLGQSTPTPALTSAVIVQNGSETKEEVTSVKISQQTSHTHEASKTCACAMQTCMDVIRNTSGRIVSNPDSFGTLSPPA